MRATARAQGRSVANLNMAEGPDDAKHAEQLRLWKELDRFEQEYREVDLRDSRAVEACQRKLEALRRQIRALCGIKSDA